MNHLRLFEDFDYYKNQYKSKIKGLRLITGSDFMTHYVVVEYKKPFFGKAPIVDGKPLENGRHKFTFKETSRRPRTGDWFDQKGRKVTDEKLLDDLVGMIGAIHDDEMGSFS